MGEPKRLKPVLLSVMVDEDLMSAISKLAERLDVDVVQLVRYALKKQLTELEKSQGIIDIKG